ncbi:MAG: cytochrome c biogenesis protein DipZ [Pseudochelatococcus sp.]|jgi:cytochrome c biogenesis protein CcdA/thiol-disulfide isomerase/thioredoxin|uniref:cytochrome c biogenesis protein DipZ n=1 Tax=Pseudochelatococcus sp. TaxID=2020869 RepID=UPI003D94F6AF
MTILLSYLGGVLTIASPCILPVLPFVFAGAGRSFPRFQLPMLAGMAVVFAAVASLAAVAGNWAVQVNVWGRWIALALMALFGLALLVPALGARLAAPFVALGDRLNRQAGQGDSPAAALLLGAATGLLWTPCAGPILGLILTGAALQGASAQTSLLLLAYAAGAATSLAVALLAGGRVLAALRRRMGQGMGQGMAAVEWLRRGAGVAVLAAVIAIFLGLDTGLLARLSTAGTTRIEQTLMDGLGMDGAGEQAGAMMAAGPAMMAGNAMMMQGGAMMAAQTPEGAPAGLPVEGRMPSLSGAVEWLNSEPLTAAQLRGKVVLLDVWTYSCVNCLRTLPYVRAWAERYRERGLVVIGVHAPEFAFEKNIGNVREAVRQLRITYPVAIDNDYAIWRALDNRYWPAHYFIDTQGRIRHHHFGEGEYEKSERVIQQLLAETGTVSTQQDAPVSLAPQGVMMAADWANVRSPETYLGYERMAQFASAGPVARDEAADYARPAELALNRWGLEGRWTIGGEAARVVAPGGRIVFRFHARDLNLVLGGEGADRPVPFRVRVDGGPPGADHGLDVDEEGNGVVRQQRLYQLVRARGDVREHTFEIEFLEPGASAYAFTFG